MPAFALPRVVKRLTLKFAVEVAFSVLVTLAATKIATSLLAPAPEAKATLRAEAPAPVAHPLQLPEKPETELSPAMSRFMEKAALAHVSPPRPEETRVTAPALRSDAARTEEVLPAAEAPVSAAPAVWAAAQLAPRGGPRSVATERQKPSSMVVQASLPPSRPHGLGESGPTVIAAPPQAPVAAQDSKAGLAPRPKADIPEASRPMALVEAAPATPKPKKTIISRIGDAIPSPRGVVDGVGHAGKAIGDTIGSLFKF